MFIVHAAPFANKFAPTPSGQKPENISDDVCSSFMPPLSRTRSLLRPPGRSLRTFQTMYVHRSCRPFREHVRSYALRAEA
ncbi:hypothetical protein CXB36_13635 [Pseudomonas syringae pv. syringae]|nr:hypothetical protein BKC06_018090 [Pseudomonas syringae pv. syringae]MCF5552678.1 hypothetical protein [Pseudomonas syringae]POP64262.1 hypothetical protein CXB36_13635 [Pseudomonas syringae pv. syringae]